MNEEIIVELDRLVYGGEALGRLPDGRAVFIPFALPGERIQARIIKEKRGHVRAELLSVLEPSLDRISPRCIHFGVCGGCHYQHMSYATQLKAKAAILADQLQRIGGINSPPLRQPVGSPREFYYRNNIQFSLTPDGRLGFQRQRSNQVIAIQECHLPEEPLNATWPLLDLEPVPGLAQVGLRLGVEEDIQLILECRDESEPIEFSVEDLSLSAVQIGPGGTLVLAGSEQVIIEVLGRPFQVSAGAFFQVNIAMAEAMVKHLLSILPVEPGSTVLDVFCGVGLFSAFLAPLCSHLVGIEVSPAACEDFAVNLDEFDHVELYEAPAEEVLSQVQFNPDIIVVDPPRAGLEPRAMDGLFLQQAAWLAYISCDPATLARDARRLVAGGYKLEQVTPFDLFPQTYHIESISLWKRMS